VPKATPGLSFFSGPTKLGAIHPHAMHDDGKPSRHSDGRALHPTMPGHHIRNSLNYALYPHMTVRENISFPLAIRHLPSAEIKARVDKVLDLLALHPFADRDVKMLSGGAQQRTSIGRALVRDPQLILFDEPLSHPDGDQKVHLRTEIKRLQKLSAVTSILVTHDQTEATAMSDRIAVMNQGLLQQVATRARPL
jgi:multiple sugar transport system ATP-binding protein